MGGEKKEFHLQCKRLEQEAEVCKHAHFEASILKERNHLWMGLPVVAINIFIGSVLFTSLRKYSLILAPVLSLIAALLAGLQTYLNLNRKITLHRNVANQYSEIARNVRYLFSREQDGVVAIEEAWENLGLLKDQYSQVNKMAEETPLSQKALGVGVSVIDRVKNS